MHLTWNRIMTVGGVAIGALGLVATVVVAETPQESDEFGDLPPSDAEPISEAELETDTPFGDGEFVSGHDFHVMDSSSTYTSILEGCVDIASGHEIVSRLDLPHGAIITSMAAHLHDDDPASNMSVRLYRFRTVATSSGSKPTLDLLYFISSGIGDDSGYQTFADSTVDTPGADVIDHNSYTYSLRARGAPSSPDLCGVRITYTYADSSALTFHQTEPCAAFDTRPDKGGREAPLSSGQQLSFDLIRSTYAAQGGTSDTSGCSLPPGITGGLFPLPNGTVAVLLNLIALDPTSSGNLKIWDNDDTEPDGGVVVFQAGQNNGNAITIGVDDGFIDFFTGGSNGGEVVVKNQSGGATHVRGVILGYYTSPPKNQE